MEHLPTEPIMNPSRCGTREVPGHYIVAAMDHLPLSGPDVADQQVEIDIGQLGRFRVTFHPRKQARRGWPTSWIWIATEAERLAGGP
jgi:hypothetical protein